MTESIPSPDGGWRTVRKPGLDENSGFEWKNLKGTAFRGIHL